LGAGDQRRVRDWGEVAAGRGGVRAGRKAGDSKLRAQEPGGWGGGGHCAGY